MNHLASQEAVRQGPAASLEFGSTAVQRWLQRSLGVDRYAWPGGLDGLSSSQMTLVERLIVETIRSHGNDGQEGKPLAMTIASLPTRVLMRWPQTCRAHLPGIFAISSLAEISIGVLADIAHSCVMSQLRANGRSVSLPTLSRSSGSPQLVWSTSEKRTAPRLLSQPRVHLIQWNTGFLWMPVLLHRAVQLAALPGV